MKTSCYTKTDPTSSGRHSTRHASQSKSLCEVWATGLFSRTIGGSEIRRSIIENKETFPNSFTKATITLKPNQVRTVQEKKIIGHVYSCTQM